jgi:hypothetical protein
MKFACLVYFDERKLEALSESDLGAIMGDCAAWVGDLERGGQHVSSIGLETTRTSTTVRGNGDGKLSITDGPFAETKEQLGGLTIIEARDLDEALKIAGKLPGVRLGCVEVRPVAPTHVDGRAQ